ncbi:hypothetical protein [Amycolatopsis thermophila]|uniref:YbaB/EbfC DNA-binding family protein n=1 Tax=Amycolatopsis thermophila TaxID=206084 RepID=A0ABU0EVZ5_9PSEU|nr:hypothetical protein [Amycolatopsis thermophila]MDQ0379489.1 hypothetical protein [Amycolatopsis thermophila]
MPASLARAATGFGEASDAWSAAHDVLAACTLTADAFGALAQQRPLLADAVQAYNEAVADTRLTFAHSATVLAESELTLKQIDGHGELVAVRLAPGTLRTSRHPHLLGGEIVQAVAAARAAAAEHQQRLLAGLLPGGAPWTI